MSTMDDVCIYQIQIYEQMSAAEIERFAPPGLQLAPAGNNTTLLSVRSDQAGLIGLIRQLHGLGFTLLSIRRLLPESDGQGKAALL